MTTVNEAERSPGRVVASDVVCVFCPCLCDDIELQVEGDRIVETRHACALGRRRFLAIEPEDGPACWIEGRPASLEEGLDRAAAILAAARYPVIFGLAEATCEAQRAAVSLGDRVGACVDAAIAGRPASPAMPLQSVGEVTCTLGEIRHRADLVILWGVDPVSSHPRLLERHALEPRGDSIPGGRGDRYCVVVDSTETETVREAADQWISVKPGADFEALWTLRAVLKNVDVEGAQVQQATGVSLETWQALVDRMKAARYGALFFATGDAGHGGPSIGHAAHSLVRDLNAHARFVVMPLSGSANEHGARNVLAWQTGYPFAVSLADGSPRFGPGEFAANNLLGRGESDAAMVISGDATAYLDDEAIDRLARIPCIRLVASQEEPSPAVTVAFRTSEFGVRTRGTVFRMDGVPLPLRPALPSSLPAAEDILAAIECRLTPDTASRATEASPPCP